MKRLFCLISCLIFTVSCSQKTGEPFSAFDADFCVRISACCEENRCEFIYDSRDREISFVEPAELVGYTLRSDGDRILLSCEGTEIAVSEYAGRLLIICDYVFSAETEDTVSISAKDADKPLTSVRTDNCEYTFLPDGTPNGVSGVYEGMDFELSFSAFEVLP